MTSAMPALRHERVVQWRWVQVMQMVATMMSVIGSSGELPPSGIRTKCEPVSSRPVTTSSISENASISRSRSQLRHAIR